MLICPSNIFTSTNVMFLGQVFTLKRCFLLSLSTQLLQESLEINLLFKLQSPILIWYKLKRKNVSIRHNSILTLMKSGAPFYRIDIIYMIYLDVKYFSVVCLSINYEEFAVKTTLTTMRHFFAKKLNFCPSDII